MKRKGFASLPTMRQIEQYQKLSLKDRLNWLEEANAFARKTIKGKRKMTWEAFRKGTL